MNSNRKIFNIDSYPGADFSVIYGHENPTDPAFVKNRTSYVITFSYCPVLWQSKLQTDTSLSIIEAEIVALYHNCRECFPVIYRTKYLGRPVGLNKGETIIDVFFH